MSQNYTAQSVQTSYYITSTKCDVPGQIVATADGNGGIPEGATLTFNKALEPTITTNVTIKGINGLYAALPPNAVSGSKLIWSSDPVNWQVDATSTAGHYEIIPASGQDLYWFTDVNIGPIVQVRRGAETNEGSNAWVLNKVD